MQLETQLTLLDAQVGMVLIPLRVPALSVGMQLETQLTLLDEVQRVAQTLLHTTPGVLVWLDEMLLRLLDVVQLVARTPLRTTPGVLVLLDEMLLEAQDSMERTPLRVPVSSVGTKAEMLPSKCAGPGLLLPQGLNELVLDEAPGSQNGRTNPLWC
jgi:hypothetical protein